ncbi:HET-domain-containing protein [Microthyrium microscopicum]|uniref:HET-domain-containing protein n=1 Tax=Microthyrium microscopicum TaxID=703497 RepID=A0A6A6TUG0_9PEZI|nr:HET-domain-containing protein [Microthyrium microscopicum]
MGLPFQPYITLSHCWGTDGVPIQTTKSSLAKHLDEIEYAMLPKTFADAITVTAALNIKYLWIDSLCIVQDDEVDWQREAAMMAAVYENSYLTIAAVSARNGSEGMFLKLPSSIHFTSNSYSRRMPDPPNTGSKPALTTCMPREDVIDGTKAIYLRPFYRKKMKSGFHAQWPLTKRGWTMQEFMLSPRVLCFANEQIYWQCNETFHTEDGTCSVIVSRRSPREFIKLQRLSRDSRPLEYGTWCSWISEYSKRQLTRSTDRLPALAGITSYFQRITAFTPLVGCWEEDLIAYLFLIPIPEDINHHNFKINAGMPSWSWMYIQAEQFFESKTIEPHYDKTMTEYDAVYLGADIQWSGQPLVSPILKAALKYRGRVFPVNIPGFEHPDLEVPGPGDRAPLRKIEGYMWIPSKRVFFVSMITTCCPTHVYHKCLVLVAEEEPHTYRRVGVADLIFEHEATATLTPWSYPFRPDFIDAVEIANGDGPGLHEEDASYDDTEDGEEHFNDDDEELLSTESSESELDVQRNKESIGPHLDQSRQLPRLGPMHTEGLPLPPSGHRVFGGSSRGGGHGSGLRGGSRLFERSTWPSGDAMYTDDGYSGGHELVEWMARYEEVTFTIV